MNKPDDLEVNCTTFDQLIAPIMTKVNAIEASRTIHHRESLTFAAFVRLLIYYFVTPTESGRQLLTDALSAAPSLGLAPVERSTFFDGFNRFPVVWFQMLLGTVLRVTRWQTIPEIAVLGQLYCIDGSLFPALAKMVWAEYKSKSQAIKLHLCFELNRMIAVQFVVDAGNSSEREALRQMLQAGVTYIADRGYVCFQLLADIVAAQAHFVMRMKANLVYSMVETLPVALPEVVAHLFTQVTDCRVCLTGADGQPIYRLVTFTVGSERYLILTNRLALTTFQVILLYAYRWQVELLFRFLKRTLTGLHLLSTSKEGVTIQFYLLLCTALLQLRLKQTCVAAVEAPEPPANCSPTDSDTIAGLMVQPEMLRSARSQTFLATVGAKLHRYWKISIHWLITLRNLLARPFDEAAIHLLGST
jgi:hypothetical protein